MSAVICPRTESASSGLNAFMGAPFGLLVGVRTPSVARSGAPDYHRCLPVALAMPLSSLAAGDGFTPGPSGSGDFLRSAEQEGAVRRRP